jgi:hypothetical protein
MTKPLPESPWDDGAYAAFLARLKALALAHFRKERPGAYRHTADRFARLVAERLEEAFPEWRFEAYIRDNPREWDDAEHLAYVHAREILGPYSGDQIDGH